jgi:hypothetical protein
MGRVCVRVGRRGGADGHRALQMAPASLVAPIDKLSLPLTVVLAALLLGESVSWRVAAGVSLMTVGALADAYVTTRAIAVRAG